MPIAIPATNSTLLHFKGYHGAIDPVVETALQRLKSDAELRADMKDALDEIRQRGLGTRVKAAMVDLNRRKMTAKQRLMLARVFPDAVLYALQNVKTPNDFDKEGFIASVISYVDGDVTEAFGRHLADVFSKAEHIDLEGIKVDVNRALALADFSVRPGRARSDMRRLVEGIRERGDVHEAFDAWWSRGEVPGTVDDRVRTEVIRRWVQRGFRKEFSQAELDAVTDGQYDEHFLTLYNEVLGSSSASNDPIDRISSAVSTGSPWNFTVETFEEIEDQGVEDTNILAAGAIDYIYELGERMGLFRLADAMVLNWSAGAIDVAHGPAADKLYRYWKQLERRSTPEERGMLYRRVLNKGTTHVLDRMVPNEHFPALWHQLLAEVADFIEKSEKVESGSSSSSPVKRSRIYQATKELQYNLTEYCTGMAHRQAEELYAQLTEAIDLFRDEDIIAHFGGSRRKNMWTVIERLSKAEFGTSPSIGAIRSLAVDGNKLFQWIANFDQTTVSDYAFDEFLEAAETYILNASLVDDTLPETDDEFADDDFEDDFDDDFDDDFEGEFDEFESDFEDDF